MQLRIRADKIGKYFGEKRIFRNIDFDIQSGQSLAIVGPNGSGKTTLVRIISHLLLPTEGKIEYFINGTPIDYQEIYKYVGLVGPYLEMYEDLTAYENLKFFAKMRDLNDPDPKIAKLMELMSLSGRENDLVRTYSSGMKQRLKYVFALLAEPEILILDEPTSNLDEQGIAVVYQIMEEYKKDRILIIATNENQDLKYGDQILAVNA